MSPSPERLWRRRITTRHVPHEDTSCGWLEPLPALPPPRRLAGEVAADLVIVGAGFTGLAAARRALELNPRWRVVVLDAQRAGGSASGRSSGYLVDIAFFTTTFAPDAAARHVRLSRAGIAELATLTQRQHIDCDWDDRGWLHVAAGEAGARDLATLAEWLRRHHEPFEELDARALTRATGSDYYRAGLRMPGRPLVHAGKLVRGLAASLPPEVELYEQTPVRAVTRTTRTPHARHETWRVTTAEGAVVAPRVILAVNGCSPALGVLGRRLFPLVTFGSLTRPLSAAEQTQVGELTEWGVLAQDPMGSSVRRTRDQRLLIRNSAHFAPDLRVGAEPRRQAEAAHRRALAARWPALAEVPFEYSWAGIMGCTPARLHYCGELAPGLWAAAGFTGAGIAMGTTCGLGLAEMAAGADGEIVRDLLALPRPGRIPPQPFANWGIGWRVKKMNAAAGDVL